jgi:hypothetical protein
MDWHVEDRWMLLATVTVGAIIMYLFNAFTGPRWRIWLRDHLIHSLHRCRDALAAAWRDAGRQVRDLFAEARLLFEK